MHGGRGEENIVHRICWDDPNVFERSLTLRGLKVRHATREMLDESINAIIQLFSSGLGAMALIVDELAQLREWMGTDLLVVLARKNRARAIAT